MTDHDTITREALLQELQSRLNETDRQLANIAKIAEGRQIGRLVQVALNSQRSTLKALMTHYEKDM